MVLVRTDVSDKRIASVLRVDTISSLRTISAVASYANFVSRSLDLSTLKVAVTISSKTSILTGTTLCHIPEYGILPSHRLEGLTS
jgi:hypothetical protein